MGWNAEAERNSNQNPRNLGDSHERGKSINKYAAAPPIAEEIRAYRQCPTRHPTRKALQRLKPSAKTWHICCQTTSDNVFTNQHSAEEENRRGVPSMSHSESQVQSGKVGAALHKLCDG